MRIHKQRTLVLSVGLFSILALLTQCAWFTGEKPESTLVKPYPVGGYEALSTRIYYPHSIREKGIEGLVTIKALVSQDGQVIDVRITDKLDPELDQIAVNAVQRTPFTPALRNGIPESVWISIPFHFALHQLDSSESPFAQFELLVYPNPSYQSFKVEIRGRLKPSQNFPLWLECLLPTNADKVWAKRPDDGLILDTRTVRDNNGEWLIVEVVDQEFVLGFDYHPLVTWNEKKFQYKVVMNHSLPDWSLAIIYGDQKLRFTQSPNHITEQADGTFRFEYELKSLAAYEPLYLEIGLIE